MNIKLFHLVVWTISIYSLLCSAVCVQILRPCFRIPHPCFRILRTCLQIPRSCVQVLRTRVQIPRPCFRIPRPFVQILHTCLQILRTCLQILRQCVQTFRVLLSFRQLSNIIMSHFLDGGETAVNNILNNGAIHRPKHHKGIRDLTSWILDNPSRFNVSTTFF